MVNINGISFSLCEFSFNLNRPVIVPESIPLEDNRQPEKKVEPPKAVRLISNSDFETIIKRHAESTVILIIQLTARSSWHLITPVIETQQGFYIFNNDCALEGSGGGLSRTRKIFYAVQNARKNGFSVQLVAKVCDNELIREFHNDISKWDGIKETSLMLDNMDGEEFSWIIKQYKALLPLLVGDNEYPLY